MLISFYFEGYRQSKGILGRSADCGEWVGSTFTSGYAHRLIPSRLQHEVGSRRSGLKTPPFHQLDTGISAPITVFSQRQHEINLLGFTFPASVRSLRRSAAATGSVAFSTARCRLRSTRFREISMLTPVRASRKTPLPTFSSKSSITFNGKDGRKGEGVPFCRRHTTTGCGRVNRLTV